MKDDQKIARKIHVKLVTGMFYENFSVTLKLLKLPDFIYLISNYINTPRNLKFNKSFY